MPQEPLCLCVSLCKKSSGNSRRVQSWCKTLSGIPPNYRPLPLLTPLEAALLSAAVGCGRCCLGLLLLLPCELSMLLLGRTLEEGVVWEHLIPPPPHFWCSEVRARGCCHFPGRLTLHHGFFALWTGTVRGFKSILHVCGVSCFPAPPKSCDGLVCCFSPVGLRAFVSCVVQ